MYLVESVSNVGQPASWAIIRRGLHHEGWALDFEIELKKFTLANIQCRSRVLTMRIYHLANSEMKQVLYRLLKALGAVSVAMLIAGALIGGYEGLGIILIFSTLPWLIFFVQHKLMHLPSAPTTVEVAVRAQSRRLGIAPPAVYQLRDTKPVASAMNGVHDRAVVVVHSGLFRLPKDEIEGVTAHELAHVKNRDSRLMMGVVAAVGLVGTSVAFGIVDKWAVVGVVVGVLPLVSWACELRADALGARVCSDPLALSRALQRPKSFNWLFGLILLLLSIFVLLYFDSIPLLHLLVLSYAVALTLPTHPPTLLRTRLLHRESLATGAQ